MKKLLPLLIAITLAVAGCGFPEDSKQAEPQIRYSQIDGRWYLQQKIYGQVRTGDSSIVSQFRWIVVAGPITDFKETK